MSRNPALLRASAALTPAFLIAPHAIGIDVGLLI